MISKKKFQKKGSKDSSRWINWLYLERFADVVFLLLTYYIERALNILHANRRSLTFKKHDNMAFTDASRRMKGKSPTVPNKFARTYEKRLSDTEIERKQISKVTADRMPVSGISGVPHSA